MCASDLEVSLEDVWPVLIALAQNCMPVEELAEKLGLSKVPEMPSGTLTDKSESYIRLADFFSVLNELSYVHYDESCRLSERSVLKGAKQFILDNLSHCRTLREGMNKLVELSNFLNGAPYVKIQEVDDQILIIMDDSHFPYRIHQENILLCFVECLLVHIHTLILYVTGSPKDFPLPYISIKRPNFGNAKHLNFWNGRIKFSSSFYVLAYDRAVGEYAMEVPSQGYKYQAFIEWLVRFVGNQKGGSSHLLSDRVSQILYEELKTQQQISEILGVSVATMRRRLAEEGTNFRHEKQKVQRKLSVSLISAGYATGDVAERLGFSDLRSFSYAFKSWYQVTPCEYRLKMLK